MLFCKTAGPSEWKSIVASVATVTLEATFSATTEGLSFISMDAQHIALVEVTFPNSAFEKWDCDKEIKFTARVEDLKKIISRVYPKDSVEMSCEEGEQLTFDFVPEKGSKRQFKCHLLETKIGTTPVPKLDSATELKVPRTFLDSVLGDIGVAAEKVCIETDTEGITFSGKGDGGEASQNYPKDSLMVSEYTTAGKTKAKYSIDMIQPILKALSNVETVKMQLGDKKPIRLVFDLNEQGARLVFFLAPRIEGT